MTIFRPRIGNSTFPGPFTHTPRRICRPTGRCLHDDLAPRQVRSGRHDLQENLHRRLIWGVAGKPISYGRSGPLSILWGREKLNLAIFVKQRT